MMRNTLAVLMCAAVIGCANEKPAPEPLAFTDSDAPEDGLTARVRIARSIAFGETVEGTYAASGYVGYTFQAAAGARIDIDLGGLGSDPVLFLYGPKVGTSWTSANPIAINDDYGG